MKEINGIIVSSQVNNTVIVAVEVKNPHKKYRKIVRQTKRYQVHLSGQTTSLGDKVRICPMKPVSKKKCWQLISADPS
jgi:small subunit ribosomal protein S17